jgi:NAD-dependent dihydropyrimidine dehydrogenase PreA subunit/predicted transcriptional regulator
MSKAAYQALTSRFEGSGGLPLPPGKNGPLTEWFKYWLTEEEAGFLAQLPWLYEAAPLEAIAKKLGMTQAETAKALETLTDKTLVIGSEVPTEEGEVRYFGLSSIFFFLESYLNRYYDDHLDDPDEIHANLGHWFEELKSSAKMEPKAKEMRIIPIAKAVEDPRGSVSTYDAIQLIEKTAYVGVLKCLCRSTGHLAGTPCEYPLEVCIVLGGHAREYIEGGFGREVTKEWAIETVKECEEMGLCHSVDNIEDDGDASIICNCCPCHCIPLTGYKMADQAARIARSELVNTVDLDECVGSGECVEACSYGALELVDDRASVKEDRCIGCGVCCTVCPTKALSLRARPMEKRDKIYPTTEEYMAAMAD